MQHDTNWVAILVTFSVGVLAAVQVGRIAPAATSLNADFVMSLSQLGLLVSLVTLPATLFGMVAGYGVVQVGARKVMLLGLVLMAACVFASSVATSVSTLLTIRSVEGIGYLAIVIAAPTLISSSASQRDISRALVLWGTFNIIGLSLGSVFGGGISEELGWRIWFVLNGIVILAFIYITYVIMPCQNTDPLKADGERILDWRLPLASWLLGASFFNVALISLTTLSMLPPFLIDFWNYSPEAAGNLTGTIALSSTIGSFCYVFLIRKSSLLIISGIAVTILAVASVLAFGIPNSAVMSVGATFVVMTATGFLVAAVFSSVPQFVSSPEKVGPANGLVVQFGGIGALSGPPLVGLAVSSSGWEAMTLILIALSALFMLLLFFAERCSRSS